MDQGKEQRVCIKFCANLGKSATETLKVIQQGFGDQSLSHTRVFQWQIVLDTLTEKDFQEAFQKWRRWWDQCLHAGGNYFEDDGG